MADKILTLHPDKTKQGVNIDKAKYDIIRSAAFRVLKREEKMKPMKFLHAIGDEVGPGFDGSATWYGETIKLDMEARGELEHDRKKGYLWLSAKGSKVEKSNV